jgi:ribonucleotide reductase alpha subunit
MELLSESFLKKYKDKQPKWGFDGLGYIVYKRTYSRTKTDGSTEEWWETIKRCIDGAQLIGADYTKEEAERLFDYIFNLKGSFSGRALWQLGTPLVSEHKLGDSLVNCWGTKISVIEDFCFVLMESMFGGGVTENISKEYSQELPRVKRGVRCLLKNTKDADHIIPDSKEGWVNLWEKILRAYLIDGKGFSYSAVCIRPAGEPLKTFGGIAPGPKPLIDNTLELCRVLERREGKKLRTEDVNDIICIGGEMIKSGGVRRTALLVAGDTDDVPFSQLKDWNLGSIPNYRSNSNNSFLCPKVSYLSSNYWDSFSAEGETYGLINLPLCRKVGRLGEQSFDGFDLTNEDIIAVNPCAEATLEDKEACNLGELAINNIKSKEEMLDIATLIYKTQKAICTLRYYHKESEEVIHRNFKLGLSITGVCQRLDVIESWADYVYKGLRKFDKEWSKKKGYPQSNRLTVIQPSGTKGLLLGASPGGHPGFAKYFIRRIRFDSNDPLISVLKEHGYHLEPELRFDGTLNHNLLVVEFPCAFDEKTVISKDCGAIKQLEIMKMLQSKWADQSVSITVYYQPEEVPQIKEWLKSNYDKSVKTVSFLLHKNHGFKQAPYEEITEQKYLEMKSQVKPFVKVEHISSSIIDGLECTGGICPVR